jgi:hypothetical protein
VRGVNHLGLRPAAGLDLIQSRAYPIRHGLNEERMIVEGTQFVNFRRARAHFRAGFLDVLQILPAAGV